MRLEYMNLHSCDLRIECSEVNESLSLVAKEKSVHMPKLCFVPIPAQCSQQFNSGNLKVQIELN